MARPGSWTLWHEGWTRVGVVALAAVATIAIVVRYPTVLEAQGDVAARNDALSYEDREIAGGNGVVANQRAVFAARGLIPADATYRVSVSPAYRGGTRLTAPFVESYYHYFLMPRRISADARWIVCYRCELDEYGPRAEVVWTGRRGVSIVRLGW